MSSPSWSIRTSYEARRLVVSGIRGSSRTSTTTHQPSSSRPTADTPSVGWPIRPSRARQAARAACSAPRTGGVRRAVVVEDFLGRGRRSSAMSSSRAVSGSTHLERPIWRSFPASWLSALASARRARTALGEAHTHRGADADCGIFHAGRPSIPSRQTAFAARMNAVTYPDADQTANAMPRCPAPSGRERTQVWSVAFLLGALRFVVGDL